MAPRKAVVKRDVEEESSSSESGAESDWDEGDQADAQIHSAAPEDAVAKPKLESAKKITISLNKGNNKNLYCKVCGKTGHLAGFLGSVYLDCPNRPCYLCKKPGHTTATCPFKVAAGKGAESSSASSSLKAYNVAKMLMSRTLGQGPSRPQPQKETLPRYQIEAAIYKLFTRRICCLEFHPHLDHLVIAGDKKGHLGVWNYMKVHDHTVYSDIHKAVLNQIRMIPWMDTMSCCTASADGTVKIFDLETGMNRTLLNMNPGGWSQGGPWTMAYCCSPSSALNAIVAGDSDGVVHVLDHRIGGHSSVPDSYEQGQGGSQLSAAASSAGGVSVACRSAEVLRAQVHKKDKIVTLDIHPLDQRLMLTGGNDRIARLSDLRMLTSSCSSSPAPERGSPAEGSAAAAGSKKELAASAATAYKAVVSSAYFSPITGNKILTTCQDNRVRVWDNLSSLSSEDSAREIVHSHDFNRYLTAFRAEWDPKDPTENTFVIGRYISEDFNGQALHPIDIYNASTGRLLQVNKPHPRRDVIISGSSRSIYAWGPEEVDDDDESTANASGAGDAAQAGPSSADANKSADWMRSANFLFFDADPDAAKKKRKTDGNSKNSKKGKQAGSDSDD
eukprot:gene12578-15802_t